MKNIRTAVALFLIAVFLAGTAFANTSSINPNVPGQNSPLSSSVLRGNFGGAYNDENTIYGMLSLSSNQILGTVNAGNAGPINLPICATGALSWTPGTGFGCNSLSGLISPVTQSLIFTGVNSFNLNSTTLPTKQIGTVLQIGNTDTIASRLENDAFSAAAYLTGVRSDGTNAAPTTLQSGDEIVALNAWGYNGSSTVGPRASVSAYAAQNWTGSAQGTYLSFKTALNGSTTPAEVCRFENDGGVTCPATVTGGDQGPGRINASGLFVNGVAVSTGNSSLSALTAALASNSIENGANAQVWNFDALTTQTALQITGTGVTTGQLFNSSVANPASTGYAGYFSNTGTATAYGVYATEAGASNTGYAGYFNNSSASGFALYSNGAETVNGILTVTGNAALQGTTTANNLTVTGTCTGCGAASPGGSAQALQFKSGSSFGGASALYVSTTRGGLDYASVTTNSNLISLGTNGTDTTSFVIGGGAGLYLTTTGNGNTIMGLNAVTSGFGTASGNQLTAIGDGALQNSGGSAASSNTGVGYHAGQNQIGGGNTYVGALAGGHNSQINNSNNTLLGYSAGVDCTGGTNTGVGVNVFSGGSCSGSNNVAMGYEAGQGLTAGGNNVLLGYEVGISKLSSGSNNVMIGALVGTVTLTTGSSNILIGNNNSVDTPLSSTTSFLNIGNTIIATMVAPTISSGFGTSPSVINGTSSEAFTVNVGTGGSATSGVVAFANAAPHGYACDVVDQTTTSSTVFVTKSVPTSTTTSTFTNYNTSGAAAAWAASDVLVAKCNAY